LVVMVSPGFMAYNIHPLGEEIKSKS